MLSMGISVVVFTGEVVEGRTLSVNAQLGKIVLKGERRSPGVPPC